LRVARRRGIVREAAVVVGTEPKAVRIAELLAAHPELGLSPCGFLDSEAPAIGCAYPVLGDVAVLPDVVARYAIRRVIVCLPDAPDALLARVLRGITADVCVVPRLPALGIRVPLACLDEIWDVPLIPLRRPGRVGPAAKRVFDLVVGTLLLVAFAPLLGGLALAVRLGSAVPALFRQDRISGPGRRVAILKLRTLADDDHSDTRWAVDPGSRLRFGGFLRASHLDELPQLVNVVRGEMSLVGPRPERPFFAELFAERIPGYADRHRMPAGMTGWAQVHGLHGDTSIGERARFDNRYIEYWSLWQDVVILARTLAKLVPGGKRWRR
jgi:lipopolysaccharide/colanic/teichoic acid biosynthesis glycosyltransferase